MTLLYKGTLFVCVSCKPVRRYALIIRIELSFGCGEETMVNLNLKLISLISWVNPSLVIIFFCLPFPLQCRDMVVVGYNTPSWDPRSCINSAFLLCS